MNVGKKEDQNHHTSVETLTLYCKLCWLGTYISGNYMNTLSSSTQHICLELTMFMYACMYCKPQLENRQTSKVAMSSVCMQYICVVKYISKQYLGYVTDQSSHCSCGCCYGWYNPASNQLRFKSVHILDGVHGCS